MTSEAFVGRVNAFDSSRGNVTVVHWLKVMVVWVSVPR
jgi:hypothetical protein